MVLESARTWTGETKKAGQAEEEERNKRHCCCSATSHGPLCCWLCVARAVTHVAVWYNIVLYSIVYYVTCVRWIQCHVFSVLRMRTYYFAFVQLSRSLIVRSGSRCEESDG